LEKNILLLSFLIFGMIVSNAQSNTYREMNGVRFYAFTSVSYPDSLEICYGEGIIASSATSIINVSPAVLKSIASKVIKSKCTLVFLDINRLYKTKSSELYWLGLLPKNK